MAVAGDPTARSDARAPARPAAGLLAAALLFLATPAHAVDLSVQVFTLNGDSIQAQGAIGITTAGYGYGWQQWIRGVFIDDDVLAACPAKVIGTPLFAVGAAPVTVQFP